MCSSYNIYGLFMVCHHHDDERSTCFVSSFIFLGHIFFLRSFIFVLTQIWTKRMAVQNIRSSNMRVVSDMLKWLLLCLCVENVFFIIISECGANVVNNAWNVCGEMNYFACIRVAKEFDPFPTSLILVKTFKCLLCLHTEKN